MSYHLGVDLGTTFTSAAVLRDGHVEVVPLGDHAPQIPSVAYRPDEGPLLFGEVAAIQGRTRPERVAREFKRRMGDRTSILLGGSPISAHVLLGQLLASVVDRVSAGQGARPDSVALSCPANWGPFRRELMDQVVSVAGLPGARVCTEPEAAATHFASTGRVREGDSVAVYDLGGGTFDATVLRADSGGRFVMPGQPEGIEQLGGIDFDAAVLSHVLRTLRLEDVNYDDESVLPALTRLRQECTDAKEVLSVETETAIAVDLDQVRTTVRMTRSELEDLIHEPLEQTVSSLLRAVTHAGLKPQDVSAVLVVGGSARIPLVSQLLTERLGRPVAVSSQPKHCVAMGAALLAAPAVPQAPAAPTTAAQTTALPVPPPAPPAAPQADVTTTSPAPAPETQASDTPAQSPGQDRPPRRRPHKARGYAVFSLLVAAVTVLLVLFPRLGPSDHPLDLDANSRTPAVPEAAGRAGRASPAKLTLTLAGFQNPAGDPIKADKDGTFDLKAFNIILAGPVEGTVSGVPPSVQRVWLNPTRSWWSRLGTIPGAVMLLAALFVAAYSESLLRTVARRRDRVRAGEVVGMAGVGAIAGVLVALAAWILVGRPLTPASVGISVVGLCAALGLLPFAVAQRSAGQRPGAPGGTITR